MWSTSSSGDGKVCSGGWCRAEIGPTAGWLVNRMRMEINMKRYQVVDERMEQQQIVGHIYFESEDDGRVLELMPRLRKKNPDIPLVVVDTWRSRQPIA